MKKIIRVSDCNKNNSNCFDFGTIGFSQEIRLPNRFVKPLEFDNQAVFKLEYEIPIEEVISKLVGTVKVLKDKVDYLEKISRPNALLAQDSLKEIWDNGRDEIWNDI